MTILPSPFQLFRKHVCVYMCACVCVCVCGRACVLFFYCLRSFAQRKGLPPSALPRLLVMPESLSVHLVAAEAPLDGLHRSIGRSFHTGTIFRQSMIRLTLTTLKAAATAAMERAANQLGSLEACPPDRTTCENSFATDDGQAGASATILDAEAKKAFQHWYRIGEQTYALEYILTCLFIVSMPVRLCFSFSLCIVATRLAAFGRRHVEGDDDFGHVQRCVCSPELRNLSCREQFRPFCASSLSRSSGSGHLVTEASSDSYWRSWQ